MTSVEYLPGSTSNPSTESNIGPLLSRMGKILGEQDLQNMNPCLIGLTTYVARMGELPRGFRLMKEPGSGFLSGATHVSHPDWGWMGHRGFLAFIHYDPTIDNNRIDLVAVLRSKTFRKNYSRKIGIPIKEIF